MSQQNVDRTIDFIESYNRRDFDAATQFFDPEVDWVLPSWPAALEAARVDES
jgi:hypothetical protein